MISKQIFTGYVNSHANIVAVWIWHDVFKTQAPMRFLPGSYSDIADVWIQSESAIGYGEYPFTAKTVEDLAHKNENEIRNLLLSSNVPVLTVRINDKGVTPVRPEEFVDYFPYYSVKDELFIFDTEESKGGFPAIYFMPKSARNGLHLNTLDVLAHISHETYNPSGPENTAGREFLYLLVQAKVLGRFSTDIPTLKDVNFPSNGRDEIPAHYNLEEMEKIAERSGVDKLPAKATGNVPMLPAPKVEEEDDGDGEFDLLSDPEVEDRLVKEILTRGSVNLTDVLQMGVARVLKLIGDTDFVVEVTVNVPDIAKKMAIWMNSIWVIPSGEPFDSEESFGESESYFVVCDDKNFPKNAVAG